MRIVHINRRDLGTAGGADRAGARIHLSLLAAGIDSRYLSVGRDGQLPGSAALHRTALERFAHRTAQWRAYRRLRPHIPTRTPFQHGWGGRPGLVGRIKSEAPDIVHLHWFAGGVLPVSAIPRIPTPMVLTLHDEWMMTGGCHYRFGCERHLESCGCCPQLSSTDPFDVTRRMLAEKRAALNGRRDLRVITTTDAMARTARRSSVLGGADVRVIPYPIDTEFWRPAEDRSDLRRSMGIRSEDRILAFAAGGQDQDPTKGFDLLARAFSDAPTGTRLVIAGGSGSPDAIRGRDPIARVGHLTDRPLRDLFRVADALILPSREEAFGQVAIEAMAVGTPVVAFATAGPAEIVTHQRTGYLARPFEVEDLTVGIRWIAGHHEPDVLRRACREDVERRYGQLEVARRHVDLYRELLDT